MAAVTKRIILITGGMWSTGKQRANTNLEAGNSGIGLELAAQLAAEKTNHVIVGSRSVQKGEAALKDLNSRNPSGSVELLELDVSKKASINAAAAQVTSAHGRLDALVNNAGVAMFPESVPIEEQMTAAFTTNAIGPWLMTEAFAPLLKKSTTTPRIVSVSSGVGSISNKLNRESPMFDQVAVQYRTSKAAMNMVTACQVTQYEKLGWKIFSYCPGFTVSNLSDFNVSTKGAKPTSEGARPIVDILNGKRDDEHSLFLTGDGQYQW